MNFSVTVYLNLSGTALSTTPCYSGPRRLQLNRLKKVVQNEILKTLFRCNNKFSKFTNKKQRNCIAKKFRFLQTNSRWLISHCEICMYIDKNFSWKFSNMCLSARTIMNLIILSHYFQKYQDLWLIFSSVCICSSSMYVVDLTRSSQYTVSWKLPPSKLNQLHY